MMENFKKEAYKIRLTPEEKAAMRRQIFGAPSTVATASPYYFFNFQFRHALVPMLAVLVVLFGTGTAYAAEGSLPGDALYTVKIHVTEPVRAALAVSPEARADVHIALAERRVEEAQALAADGRLSATTTQELADNFDEHVAEADALALEVGHNDPAAAVEINARAESGLSVQGAILASLGDDSNNKDIKTNSGALAARVRAHIARANGAAVSGDHTGAKVATNRGSNVGAQTTSAMRVQTFAATAPMAAQATATAQLATDSSGQAENQDSHQDEHADANTSHHESDQLQARATNELKKAREQYKDGKDKFSSGTIAVLDVQFAKADSLLASGDSTGALQLALKLQSVLKAQTKFRANIIPPLLQLNIGGGEGQD